MNFGDFFGDFDPAKMEKMMADMRAAFNKASKDPRIDQNARQLISDVQDAQHQMMEQVEKLSAELDNGNGQGGFSPAAMFALFTKLGPIQASFKKMNSKMQALTDLAKTDKNVQAVLQDLQTEINEITQEGFGDLGGGLGKILEDLANGQGAGAGGLGKILEDLMKGGPKSAPQRPTTPPAQPKNDNKTKPNPKKKRPGSGSHDL